MLYYSNPSVGREAWGCFKKVPYSVLTSDSEASLTSFGTGSHRETPRLTPRGDKKKEARGDISHLVFPRHASAEGPLASLGATKKRARGDIKIGSK
jgi:hypothetical protein